MDSEKINLVKYYCSQRGSRVTHHAEGGACRMQANCRVLLINFYHVVHTLLCEVMVVTSDFIVHHVPHPLIRKRHKECIHV